jgi:hypothetical protein
MKYLEDNGPQNHTVPYKSVNGNEPVTSAMKGRRLTI